MWSEQVSGELGKQRARDVREGIGHSGIRGWMRRLTRTSGDGFDDPVAVIDGVTIRRSRAADHDALVLLAQLDSRVLADGELLVAEVDGELRAALPLGGGPAIADPFRPTAPLVSLLGLRASQLRQAEDAQVVGSAAARHLIAAPNR
jgi:hypothetical protein